MTQRKTEARAIDRPKNGLYSGHRTSAAGSVILSERGGAGGSGVEAKDLVLAIEPSASSRSS
jgi:hypothetical protein